jgi:3-hexulose-6-phosphate synthase/6-phospho-3-hexuloisomerase
VGAVIDGSCRDTDEARLLGFPVTSRYVGPRAAHTATSGRKEPIEVNVPIVCGGIIVNPGDLVVADEIGVTVVPYHKLEEVYQKARKQADNEIASREAILKGARVEDLLRDFGRI